MKYRKIFLPVSICFLFIFAIINAELVVAGAYTGIDLCLKVIIPSIFPFLFLSMLICNYWSGTDLSILRPICKITGIPSGHQSILLLACIGGYPVGAQAIVQAWKNGRINRSQAQRLMGFCNNAGPSFIFGLMSTVFEGFWFPLLLWVIHIGSAFLVGILLPDKKMNNSSAATVRRDSISQILLQSIKITGTICGWVTLFRIVLHFMESTTLLQSTAVKAAVFGLIELSNGCILLKNIVSTGLRFMIASGLLSVGGLCVGMQTASVTGKLGLGLYIQGKLLQTCISVFSSSVLGVCLFHDQTCRIAGVVSLCCIMITYTVIKRK